MTWSRRRFLTATALAAAAPTVVSSRVLGAGGTAPSNRITMGLVGIGKQGEYHLRRLVKNDDVQILGIAEVYRKFRDMAVDLVNSTYSSSDCKGTVDYRELLGRDEIQAVLIATPDHWHALGVLEAARRGKDIYCEKPLSLTIHEAHLMTEAVRRYGSVFQTGSQQRSGSEFRQACELVRNGRIGRIKHVHVNVGGPSKPCDLPGEPTPDGLEWDRWLGPAPVRPFNAILRPPHNKSFPRWRAYREYSGGGMTDWGAHHFDIAQWGLGKDGTAPVEIHPPGKKHPKMLTYIYADGTPMYHGGQTDEGRKVKGVLFTGEKGWVEVNRGHLATEPESLRTAKVGPNDVHLYKSPGHHRDWLQCIRTRKRPICDVAVGASSVTVCHLGNIAYWLGRSLKYDPKKHDFVGDREASRWVRRPHRAPYTL
jgi:predicted dehydrogenase